MRTVQMTLDDNLVRSVDRAAKLTHTTRSAFTRNALREALRSLHAVELEHRHRDGYARHPVSETEFSVWEGEQAWGDA